MEKYVEFQRDGLTLRGMLHLPESLKEKPPVVVILHGFGGDRNAANYSLTHLSRRLAKKGIASVRFDFLYNGESDGDFVDMTISGEIADACAMVDFTQGLEEVDTSRIALFGLSLGGAVASAAAARRRAVVQCLCLCCPATNSVDDARNKRVKGMDISDIFEHGSCDIGGLRLGKGFYDDALTIDFYEMAQGFDKNVLLVHGDKDIIAPLENSKKYIALYGECARLEIIEGGDHSFTTLPTNECRLSTITNYFVSELIG